MDSELTKLSQALRAPGMSDASLRSVSIPAANLAVWLRAVLRYGLAQRRGLPTGLLLRQVDATLAREQARLGQFQFQAHDLLEQTLFLTKKLEEAQLSHNRVMETLNQAQCGHFHRWPMKSALLTPMHMWTTQLQVMNPYVPYVSLPVNFIPLFPSVLSHSPQVTSVCPSTYPLPYSYLCFAHLSMPEVAGASQDCVWRCPLVLCCHRLSGSLPTTASPRTAGKVAISVSGL